MKKIIITEENSKQRIDRFLVRELFSYTRGEIINNIKNGNVTANGKIVKPSYGLKINDELEIRIKKEKTKLVPNKRVRPEIIYSDKDIIVINKPAGLQVHPVESTSSAHGVSPSDTLVHGLLNNFPEIKNVNDGSTGSELRPGIVHRLDKDTTGVMVAARNQSAFNELKKLFQKRKVKKEYLAVVFGKLKNKKGVIEKPVARSKNYKKQT
ncbi:MAG TPA: RluA family pseudouridine synthase, partial [Patescibacteria group bacterium]